MDLQLRIKYVFDDQSGVTLEDITDHTARSSVGLFIYGYLMDKNAVETYQLNISNVDYATASEWFVPTPKDAWLKFHFFAIKNWDEGESYSASDVRQHEGKIYVCPSAGAGLAQWQEVTFKDLLDNPILLADTYYLLYNDKQDTGIGKKIVELADEVGYACATNCKSSARLDELEKVLLLNDGMNIKFWAEEPQRGAVILECIQNKIKNVFK